MGRFNRVLDHLEEWLVASFMALATGVIFISVVYRYSADIPWIWNTTRHINLTWAQELCIYLFIWMAKFGAAYGVRTGIHVGVDVLVNNLPEKMRPRFIMFGLLAGAFFTAGVGPFRVRLVLAPAPTHQTPPPPALPVRGLSLPAPP